MKRLSLKIAVLVLVFGLTAFISLAFAGGPANRATGKVDLEQNGIQINFTFNAHMPKDGRPAKGNMSVITISTGSFWEASVTSVSINPTENSAEFVGIVEASGDGQGGPHPSVPVGSKMWARVYDQGEPEAAEVVLADFGGLTDTQYANFCSWATNGGAAQPTVNSSKWNVLGGNIQVKVIQQQSSPGPGTAEPTSPVQEPTSPVQEPTSPVQEQPQSSSSS